MHPPLFRTTVARASSFAAALVLLGACTSRRSAPDLDSGTLRIDSGTLGIDAQVGLDASMPPDDGGHKTTDDGGILRTDSGTPPTDGGVRYDSGPTPIDAGPPPVDAYRVDAPPASCPEMDLGSALGDAITSGSTVGYADTRTLSCGSSGAPDRAFSWTAPATGSYIVDLNGSSYDTMMEVYAGSCTGAVLGCNDDGGSDTDSLVRVTLAAGDVIVIRVDGYGGSSGTFQVNIHEDLGAEVCDNGTDDDRDGDTDCIDGDCSSLDACIEVGPTECHDGTDDDGDTYVDCDDGDCYYDCMEAGMCDDAFDNDADGLMDCADDECTCDPVCHVPTCPDQDLGTGTGAPIATGTLDGTVCSEREDTGCGSGGPGGEVELLWTAPSTGTFVISAEDTIMLGSTYDTLLSIRDGSCTGPELTCNDDSIGLLSSVTVSVVAGQQLVIVLDAYNSGSSGNWTLNITPM